MALFQTSWNWDTEVIIICLALLAAYLYWTRFHWNGRSFSFLAGIVLIFVALSMPMGPAPHQHLFSLHMAKHILLLMMAPPLLVVGLPEQKIRPLFSGKFLKKIGKHLFNPIFTWCLGVGTMWFWHIPAIYDYMDLAANPAWITTILKLLEVVSLLLIGVFYCWPILSPLKEYRLPSLQGIVYLFSACSGCSILGILITFATPGLYHTVFSNGATEVWGLTQQVDQQLGGLLMWVPGCFIYLSGVIVLLIRWFSGWDLQTETNQHEVVTHKDTVKA